MKRASQYLFTLLIGALASCQSDPNEVKPVSDNQLLVSIEDIQTRSSLYEDAKHKNVKTQWEVGDQIKLYSVHEGNVYSATYSAQESGSEAKFALDSEETGFNLGEFEAAYYPGENATDYDKDAHKITATIPSTQTYAANSFGNGAAPMTSNVKSGNALYFRNAFSVLKLNLTGNEKISQIRVSAPSLSTSTALSGSFDFTLGSSNAVSTAINDNANDAGYEVTLDCSTMTNALTSTATPFYIALPPMPAGTKMTTFVVGNNGLLKTFTTVTGSTPYTGNALVQNNIVDMPELNTSQPVGGFSRLFSVSSTKQVYFSKGNLQYQASTNKWRFAEHQYDYVGYDTYGNVYENSVKCDNANVSSTYTGWIDLFGWGTSGISDYSPHANCIVPWSTSTTYSDYYPYGSATTNLADNSGKADWGYNAITNGGNMVNYGWRTLTADEFDYLLNTRTTQTNNIGTSSRYSKVTVNGVNGLLIYPDKFTWDTTTMGAVPTNFNTSNANFSDSYTTTEFQNIEAAGVVFLPCAGGRNNEGAYYGFSPVQGLYWTGTYSSDIQSHNVWINLGNTNPKDADNRNYGHSVRLVQDVTNYTTTQDYNNGTPITLE